MFGIAELKQRIEDLEDGLRRKASELSELRSRCEGLERQLRSRSSNDPVFAVTQELLATGQGEVRKAAREWFDAEGKQKVSEALKAAFEDYDVGDILGEADREELMRAIAERFALDAEWRARVAETVVEYLDTDDIADAIAEKLGERAQVRVEFGAE